MACRRPKVLGFWNLRNLREKVGVYVYSREELVNNDMHRMPHTYTHKHTSSW